MNDIIYIDRLSKKQQVEKIYGKAFIKAMYGKGFLCSFVSLLLTPFICKSRVLSHLYGVLQKSGISQRKIAPFIKEFQIDATEFLEPVESFYSFNDFFIRKLNPKARSVALEGDLAVMPADARYLVYPDLSACDGFFVKGQKFSLQEFLQDESLAQKYSHGSMVLARLCPTDYHRFHYPCQCVAEKPSLLNGFLSSVNPLALRKNIHIFSENKRYLTRLHSEVFGQILYLEVGATCVGGIYHTSSEGRCEKAEEKGYFSFGGSSVVLLFEPGRIAFDPDLIAASEQRIEVKGLMGQSLGRATGLR
jgi:phosphatidylserine decarboxylase